MARRCMFLFSGDSRIANLLGKRVQARMEDGSMDLLGIRALQDVLEIERNALKIAKAKSALAKAQIEKIDLMEKFNIQF